MAHRSPSPLRAALLLFPLAPRSRCRERRDARGPVCTAAVAVLVTYYELRDGHRPGARDVRRVSLADIGYPLPAYRDHRRRRAVIDPTVTTLMTAWAIGAT